MAKKANLSFSTIMSEIAAKNYAPVYILMGEESYYLDQIIDTLEKSVIPEEDKDFDQSIFYGAEADLEIVESSARQYPMMADKRLVILKEAQSLHNAKNAIERLAPYVSRPSGTTIFALVFKGDTLKASSQLLKSAAASNAVIFTSPLLRDYQLAAPIKEYCNSRRYSIDDKASQLLIEFIGSNLSKLFGEIEKLIVASRGKTRRITCELIEENIGISKDFNNFELISALTTRNYAKAVRIADYFKRNSSKNPTIVTTGVLFNFFSKIVLANFSKDQSDNAIMSLCEIKNSFALKDLRIAQANYNPLQSLKAISLIRALDTASKGIDSLQNEHDLLKELIFKLVTL